MKVRCYSVYDRKALYYMMPFYAKTDPEAVRLLSDAVADTNSQLGRHPNDFVLYFVGFFDDSAGIFEHLNPVRHVVDAATLVRALHSEIPFPDLATTPKPSSLDSPRIETNLFVPQRGDK